MPTDKERNEHQEYLKSDAYQIEELRQAAVELGELSESGENNMFSLSDPIEKGGFDCDMAEAIVDRLGRIIEVLEEAVDHFLGDDAKPKLLVIEGEEVD